jgi:Uri superfamily endonuclease
MSQGQALPPIYHLVLRLPETQSLHVGCLGLQRFSHGYYVYTGRARRGLASRLKRHLRMEKTNHWHIDWRRIADVILI